MTKSGNVTVLHTFGGASGDGANPYAGVIDLNGTLYGTTESGGANNRGTVFGIAPSGAETVLHSFGGSGDGADPLAGLVNVQGALYGTTLRGGAYDDGTVFSITPSGTETVLHSFKGWRHDGTYPAGKLLDVKGTLYGTTEYGGKDGHCATGSKSRSIYGCGAVFKITTSGEETLLYSFDAAPAAFPDAGLINVNGTLYGTAGEPHTSGRGIVFKISTSGKESNLYNFPLSGSNGADPIAGLLNVNGTLYGTTRIGGAHNDGTVYAVTTSGTQTVLHRFAGSRDGKYPYAGLIKVGGTLYGTTRRGGDFGRGTVFAITTSGAERVIHSFRGGSAGRHPYAGLLDIKGILYGTTFVGGAN